MDDRIDVRRTQPSRRIVTGETERIITDRQLQVAGMGGRGNRGR